MNYYTLSNFQLLIVSLHCFTSRNDQILAFPF